MKGGKEGRANCHLSVWTRLLERQALEPLWAGLRVVYTLRAGSEDTAGRTPRSWDHCMAVGS